jgi:hypothetical protein
MANASCLSAPQIVQLVWDRLQAVRAPRGKKGKTYRYYMPVKSPTLGAWASPHRALSAAPSRNCFTLDRPHS